jgi:hypothetical protein
VRVLAEGAAVQAHLLQQRVRARLALGGVGADAVDGHRLDQRLADGEARVQAGIGVLEHDLDAPAHGLALAVAQREQVRPSKMTSPPVGSCRRSSVRPMVVLPEPDSPTTPSVWPRAAGS